MLKQQLQTLLDSDTQNLRGDVIKLLCQPARKYQFPDLYWALYEFEIRSQNVIDRLLQKKGYQEINPSLEELAEMISVEELQTIRGCGVNTIRNIKHVFGKYRLNLN